MLSLRLTGTLSYPELLYLHKRKMVQFFIYQRFAYFFTDGFLTTGVQFTMQQLIAI